MSAARRLDLHRIDVERFRQDFEELAEIGAIPGGGVHRPALSEPHLAARGWFRETAGRAGLEVEADGAGNQIARLRCPQDGARTLMLGSHLDSVPQGGRFDGALGVVAALEVLRSVQDAGIPMETHLEAIDFTDEEGTLVGLLGSRAVAGVLSPEELAEPRCGSATFEARLAAAGLDAERILDARRDPENLAGFLELHIEQGPRLATAGTAIGIVSGIVGIGSFRVNFGGRADHSGTTPMDLRKDAALGAARSVVAAHEMVRDDHADCVINIGHVRTQPGAFNIVPALAELAVEFRAPDGERLRRLGLALSGLFERIASDCELELDLHRQPAIDPAPCSAHVQAAFAAECEARGLTHLSMASGAGHDAGIMATLCPSGMIFVPSTGGSHSSREFAAMRDCVNGADVLLGAALRLGSAGAGSEPS